MRAVLGLIFAAALAAPAARTAEFRATDYGARGDGKTVDTAAIQKTIDAAAKAGHGTVVFRPGVYLTGALFLKSGIEFRLDAGVELRGVQDLAAYPTMPTRVAGVEMPWPAALLNVYEQSEVKISGRGVVDGDGKIWWDKYWKMRREQYEPRGLRWAVDYDCQRPRLIQIYKSTDVSLEGLTLKRSGFWTVHICYSRRITVNGTVIRNNTPEARGPSTDGVDIDSSSEVTVEHCDIECNDDAICLKAGRDADGLRVNQPTEKVVVRDNTVRAGAAGVTFGSETSGGIRGVEVYRTHVMAPVPVGILFKSASTRGGTIENITIQGMEMENVPTPLSVTFNWNPSYSYAKMPEGAPGLPGMKEVPAYWRVLTQPVPPEKGLPHLRHVRISDIHATGARRAFSVVSYPDSPLEDFELKNIRIAAQTAGSIANAANWKFTDTEIQTADGSRVTLKDCRGITGLDSAGRKQ
ncbi:MAG TPA: glycoside hydrolase family 28 protein [Bryobacteraceae bacterium]|nr:glycoside hydrolase family 28 protein [Bryobacteraceae bacterium]